MLFILLWSTLAYDPLAHWVWGVGGWLRTFGTLDFAGGTVVHVNAGIAALVASLVLGKRSTFPHRASPPHNVTLTLLGGGLLWFGWFGFNGGSALAAGAVATVAFVNTNIAAAGALVGWVVLDLFSRGKPTAVGAITGAVAGLVAITPACGFVTPLGALAIGVGASVVCFWAVSQRIKWNLDDTLDAFSVHGVGGIFGSLATGVFATTSVNPAGADGLLAGNPGLLGAQAVATLAAIVVSGTVTFILLKGLQAFGGIRSSDEDQHNGLDLAEHGEQGYHELA
jgi:Amt family ammonium transporter